MKFGITEGGKVDCIENTKKYERFLDIETGDLITDNKGEKYRVVFVSPVSIARLNRDGIAMGLSISDIDNVTPAGSVLRGAVPGDKFDSYASTANPETLVRIDFDTVTFVDAKGRVNYDYIDTIERNYRKVI